MANDNSTETPTNTSDKPPLDDNLLTTLRAIRRANGGIESCVRILIAHTLNDAVLPSAPEAFIALDATDNLGIQFAIEACSEQIANLLGEDFDKRYPQVGWGDEWLPEIRRQAQAMVELQSGDISYDEFQQRTKGGAS